MFVNLRLALRKQRQQNGSACTFVVERGLNIVNLAVGEVVQCELTTVADPGGSLGSDEPPSRLLSALYKAADCNAELTKYFSWPPYIIGQAIYIFILWFLLSFFPRLISAVGDWMSTILPHMV